MITINISINKPPGMLPLIPAVLREACFALHTANIDETQAIHAIHRCLNIHYRYTTSSTSAISTRRRARPLHDVCPEIPTLNFRFSK